MTSEEKIAEWRKMTQQELWRKYTPLLVAKNITSEQYDFILKHAKDYTDKPTGGCRDTASGGDYGGDNLSAGEVASMLGGFEGKTQKDRLLNLLSDGNYHDTPEIQAVVYGANHLGVARIASRINDLRNDGYLIETKHKDGTIYCYRLNQRVAESSASVVAPGESGANAGRGLGAVQGGLLDGYSA